MKKTVIEDVILGQRKSKKDKKTPEWLADLTTQPLRTPTIRGEKTREGDEEVNSLFRDLRENSVLGWPLPH